MSNLSYGPIYMPGDAVFYTGEKHKQALASKEGKPHKGWIHASVGGDHEGAGFLHSSCQ